MRELLICGKRLKVKDYFCPLAGDFFEALPGEGYESKDKLGLWLYVNVTNRCNAGCPFCVSHANAAYLDVVDPAAFARALSEIAPSVEGISFTGGESMLYPELLDTLISIADKIVPALTEIDLATNGSSLKRLAGLKNFERINSIHISRHFYEDEQNRKLMEYKAPSEQELQEFLASLKNPVKVVLNCVLQQGGIEDMEGVSAYLDHAIRLGVQNTSFITMFQANAYCRSHMVTPSQFPILSDGDCLKWNQEHPGKTFSVWNRHSDYTYCHCLSGSYENEAGRTRFYFRCPGEGQGPVYARQLVYTAENRLQDGFGEGRMVLWEGREEV